MLREIDKDLWVTEQPLRYFGLSIGCRMTVIRLTSGELAIISPIAIDEDTASQLSQIGTVSHIIAPNLYHYFFAANCKKRYPQATFWAAPGLDIKEPNLPIDRMISRNSDRLWNGLEYIFFDGLKTFTPSGIDPLNECVFFHAASRTLILTDAAFHFDSSFPVVTQLATKLLGGYKSLSPLLLEKVATTDKEKVRESFEKVIEWNFERVVMAHGSIAEQNGKKKLRQGYKDFLGKL